MEGDYLELSQFLYNFHQFSYNSHQSPLGTIGSLTFGIRAVDPKTSNCDQRKLLKKIQQMLNNTLEEVKDISKKMKALAESNMAMKEELSKAQEDLENMFEEELQLLEGTSDKLKLHESTELAHDFEDSHDNLCCSLSKSPKKLKEQTVVLENSKPTMFSEQRKLNNSSFVGYHFGITPTFFINVDHLEIEITPGACGPLHGKEICPKVRNSEPCDIIGTMEMFWVDMYFPFTNHSFEHPLTLRMMCGCGILATWKGIKCFKFLGALAMVYAKKKNMVYTTDNKE